MGISKFASRLGAVALGVLILAAPSAALASIPPGGGGGAQPCKAYVTPTKSGTHLNVNVHVYSCWDRNFWVHISWYDDTHSSGPHGDFSITMQSETYNHTFAENISGHTGDKYTAESESVATLAGHPAQVIFDYGTT